MSDHPLIHPDDDPYLTHPEDDPSEPDPMETHESIARQHFLEAAEHIIQGYRMVLGGSVDISDADKTKLRYAKGMLSIFHEATENSGINTTFAQSGDLIIVKDIDFTAFCEHHLFPFHGKAHIAIIPDGKVPGLSKYVRVVRKFASRLTLQEKVGQQIADHIVKHTGAEGVLVIIEANHMCMTSRGVRAHNASTTTSTIQGAFEEPALRQEALTLLLR